MRLVYLLICMGMFQSCQTSPQKEVKENPSFTGSWKFVADQEIDNNNQVKNEDTNVRGLLIYTDEGKMSVQLLWHGSRASMLTDSIMNQDGKATGVGMGNNTWTPDQARKIIDTYDAYFGDYSVDWSNHIVTHTISANLRPEKEGAVYKRAYNLVGDTLYLRSADPDTTMRWQTKWIKVK